jgi:hypothetical protein
MLLIVLNVIVSGTLKIKNTAGVKCNVHARVYVVQIHDVYVRLRLRV